MTPTKSLTELIEERAALAPWSKYMEGEGE